MLRLAADENFNNNIVRGLVRRKPDVDIVPSKTSDSLERTIQPFSNGLPKRDGCFSRIDVATLTKHAYDRVDAGLRMAGMFEVPSTLSMGRAIEDLLLIIECSLEGEWEGQVRYLPL